ncbi:NAC domain-containing protein 74, putative isoform 2 [Hibiscus syriacus]|uniref:NAC domain-containing protein 74, putative isoform 2 n=1 Tax=Hibiscus syriacus TaxID=106335 RepID=A0A6A3A763_HIBSY|nr:NAC domain-containing protein 74, putative isoform 2 [Hibiscus syriacus]
MAGEGVSRETQMFIEASSMFPGFRFSPTDVELISYYLKKKLEGFDKCVEVIPEVEICRYEPWDLPDKSVIKSVCARGRKYPNGSQSRRATEQGYWKATGKERNVKSDSNVIGTKRTLVFHTGRALRGERTEGSCTNTAWTECPRLIHPVSSGIRLSGDSLVVCRLRKNSEFRLNNTSNRAPRTPPVMHDSNRATSDGATNQTGTSEPDKAYLKKGASSYDSHSIEQFDSPSESEQKQSNEVGLTESSTPQKDSDTGEDYFAEILKDDIIKLDETPLTARPDVSPTIASTSNAYHRRSQQLRQEHDPHVSHFQGTANRRIKLRRPKADEFLAAKASTESGSRAGEISIGKLSSAKSGDSPKWLLSLFTRTANLRLIYATFVILTLLALVLTFLGGSKPVKNSRYMLL